MPITKKLDVEMAMLAAKPARGNRPWQFLGPAAVLFLLLQPLAAAAQSWNWRAETVAPSGQQTSIAVDADGNLHISYVDDVNQIVRYAFRPAGSTRWFTMDLGGTKGNTETYTKIVLDRDGNPHICYTPTVLRYAYWDAKEWHDSQLSSDAGMPHIQHSCSVAIASDGTPYVSWYQIAFPNEGHFKLAELKDRVWTLRTMDFSPQTGKFHSLAIDPQGNPIISYDAYVDGELRCARYRDGKWTTATVDSRAWGKTGDYDVGMGNAVAFNKDGQPMISYYTDHSLKLATFDGTRWKLETIDSVNPTGSWMGTRSSLVLDSKGFPHVSYDDGGLVKHAYWDGAQWRVQVVVPAGAQKHTFSSMAIGPDDTLYILYRDPSDGSLMLATGRLGSKAASASAQGQQHH